ncbi:MAG: hypothetical protein JWN30_1201 [Bacilli bacterium]|nr:hypothetical protein [Bacilli bacterium]
MNIQLIVGTLLQVYYWLLIASILMSWAPDVMRTPVGRFLTRVTEPYFGLFRRFIPPVRLGMGAIDLSPVVALFAYYFIQLAVNVAVAKLMSFIS